MLYQNLSTLAGQGSLQMEQWDDLQAGWLLLLQIYVHWEFSFLTRVYEGHVPPLRILDLGGNCGLASRQVVVVRCWI
jgi:hypothetical protein